MKPRHAVLFFLEAMLWTFGFVSLGYCAFVWGRAGIAQYLGNLTLRELTQGISSKPASVAGLPSPPTPSIEGRLFGRVEIPRLGISVVAFEGTNDGTLGLGVGHMIGTANPGQNGNLVLAAHRDTYFRPLRNVRKGDEIKITGAGGTFRYAVESTKIVQPTDIAVVNPTPDATITLITCYPFYYVGDAPERFIVKGKLIGAGAQLPSGAARAGAQNARGARRGGSGQASGPQHSSGAPAAGSSALKAAF
jgi:sortase A